MDFKDLLNSRQSVRSYFSDRAVEPYKIERILEAARLAPSACNAQPWHFIVVDEPELKNKVADATSSRLIGINHFTKQAPVHIIVVEERGNFVSGVGSLLKKKDFSKTDLGIAASHICLAAQNEGLGSCILGWLNEKKIKDLLSIPSSKRVWLDIIVGYSNQEVKKNKRKPFDKIVSYNRY